MLWFRLMFSFVVPFHGQGGQDSLIARHAPTLLDNCDGRILNVTNILLSVP